MNIKVRLAVFAGVILIISGYFLYINLYHSGIAKHETLSFLKEKYNKNFKITKTSSKRICDIGLFTVCNKALAYTFVIKTIDDPQVVFEAYYNEISKYGYVKGVQEDYLDTKKMMDIADEIKLVASSYFKTLSLLSIDYDEASSCNIKVPKVRAINEFNDINISNIDYLTKYRNLYNCYSTTLDMYIVINEKITPANMDKQVDLLKRFENYVIKLNYQFIPVIHIYYSNDTEMSAEGHKRIYFSEKKNGNFTKSVNYKDVLY